MFNHTSTASPYFSLPFSSQQSHNLFAAAAPQSHDDPQPQHRHQEQELHRPPAAHPSAQTSKCSTLELALPFPFQVALEATDPFSFQAELLTAPKTFEIAPHPFSSVSCSTPLLNPALRDRVAHRMAKTFIILQQKSLHVHSDRAARESDGQVEPRMLHVEQRTHSTRPSATINATRPSL